MQRPLPPYRVKPMRSVIVRRLIDSSVLRELAADDADELRPARAALRVAKPGDPDRLKVLGRTANDPN